MSLNVWFARIVGIILVLIGIVGFFLNPVIIFDVNLLHNSIHLVTGLLLIWAGFAAAPTTKINTIFGAIYLLVAVLGFAGLMNIINANLADHFLHAILGVLGLAVGLTNK